MSSARFRTAVLAAVLAVAACDRSPPPRRPIEPQPGVAADVILRPDEGETTAGLAVGQTLAIQLKTPFEWTEASPPGLLRRVDAAWSPADSGVRDRGETGGDQWQVFVYRAVGAGTETLVFNEVRPWEPDAVTRTARVRVVVRPAG